MAVYQLYTVSTPYIRFEMRGGEKVGANLGI